MAGPTGGGRRASERTLDNGTISGSDTHSVISFPFFMPFSLPFAEHLEWDCGRRVKREGGELQFRLIILCTAKNCSEVKRGEKKVGRFVWFCFSPSLLYSFSF